MIYIIIPVDRQKIFDAICMITVLCTALFLANLSWAQSLPSSDAASSDESYATPEVVSPPGSTSKTLGTIIESESSAIATANDGTNSAEKVWWPTLVGATGGGLVGLAIATGAGLTVFFALNQEPDPPRPVGDIPPIFSSIDRTLWSAILGGSAVALGLTIFVALPAAGFGAVISDRIFQPKPSGSASAPADQVDE